ncbi:hypothetical protein E4U57_004850 [Claviceps arundinis]|uniref:Zn(2)-C6 fungal-type domain-containing protein n=1 Tax=Claviceps arundinis TaxID=1623583 RepID=A0ABQ7PIG8_9HYPO|nr:hypothetical protein E4U57_004850 [Claviceps arundinis]
MLINSSQLSNCAAGSANGKTKKLRSACDACHASKVRCSGEPICARCQRDNVTCHYSYRAHLGKPKGSLNRKTIERMKAAGFIEQRPAASQPPGHGMSRESSVCASGTTIDNLLNFIEIQPPGESNESPVSIHATPSPCFAMTGGGLLPDFDAANLDAFLEAYQTPEDSYLRTVEEFSGASPADMDCVFVGTPSSMSRDYTEVAACRCVREITQQINNVHASSADRSTTGLDDVLHYTREISSCISGLLQCHSCSGQVQVFVLASVVLSLLMELMHPLLDLSTDTSRPRAQIRVGNYDMSGQLGDILEKVIVRSIITKLRQVVDKFEMKADFLRSETAQTEFLKSEARRLKRGFGRIEEGTATLP